MQVIIDERTDQSQRDALLKILTGEETDEMATGWWVFSAMSPNKLEPLFRPIEADRGLMALAGLWENWRWPAGEWVRSFAIITTTPNELCAELHNRMSAVLKPQGGRFGSGRSRRRRLSSRPFSRPTRPRR
jgi:hypothetical protein